MIEAGGTPAYPGCPGTPGLLNKSLERELVDGSVKAPTVRNVALTPPYFHFGGYSDLRSVVEVYARGGSRRNKSLIGHKGDTSGTGRLGQDEIDGTIPVSGVFGTNVDFFIRNVKLTDGTVDSTGDGIIDWRDDQIGALVAFMKTLTDERVRCDKGPFDHPELFVFNGHKASDRDHDGQADDIVTRVPAVGADGYPEKYCLPNAGNLFDPKLRNRLTQY